MQKPNVISWVTNRKLRLLSFLVFAYILIGLAACQKESIDDVTGGGGDGSTGRFGGHITCNITAPPADVKLDAYYTKYLNCTGIAIVSGPDVPDEALYEIDKLYKFLLSGLDLVKTQLISQGCYYAISNSGGVGFNDLPEMSGSTENVAGQFMYQYKIAFTDADNILCRQGNTSSGTNTSLHEIAHMIHLAGLHFVYKGFDAELTSAYNNALQQGLWANTYGIGNEREYLAVGVAIFYGVQHNGPVGGDGYSNEIYSRKLLQSYDPTLFSLISKYFNNASDVPGCLRPIIENNEPCVPTVTDIDGNVYNVISIGSQCWMAENLKTTRLNDGTPIADMSTNAGWTNQWDNLTTPAWTYYDLDVANNDVHGKLYNHYAAKHPKLCPQGWHMPTRTEMNYLVKQSYAAYSSDALRALTSWNNSSGATNESGFNAFASGGAIAHSFSDFGARAYFWTASNELPPHDALGVMMEIKQDATPFVGGQTESHGLSCRCVMD